MKNLVFIIIICLLFACNPEKAAQRHCRKCPTTQTIIKTDTFIQTLRDTLIKIDADTSNFWALIRCDSLNEAYLQQINIHSTQGIKTVVYFKHDTLMVNSTIDSAKIYMALKDKYKSDTLVKEKVVEKKVPYIPWWIWFLWGLSFVVEFLIIKYLKKILSFD